MKTTKTLLLENDEVDKYNQLIDKFNYMVEKESESLYQTKRIMEFIGLGFLGFVIGLLFSLIITL